MQTKNLSVIRATRRALNMVIDEGRIDKNPVPYFEPTNIGGLSDMVGADGVYAREANEHGNRVRSSTHLCLHSASEVLAVVLALSELPMDMPLKARAQRLMDFADQLLLAASFANDAAGVLIGEIEPPSDGTIVVSRIPN